MSTNVSAGVYANIVDISHVVNGAGVVAGAIVITSKKGPTEVTTVTSAKQFVSLYGIPTRDNPSAFAALRFLNRASILTVRRVVKDAETAKAVVTSGADEVFEIHAANPGAWGNKITVDVNPIVGVTDGSFRLTVKEAGKIVEQYVVNRDPDALDGFGNNVYIEETVNRRSNFIRVVDNPTVTGFAPSTTVTVALADGSDDTIAPGTAEIANAWDEFKNEEKVEAQLLINGGWAAEAVHLKILEVAEARTDAFAILDVPLDTAEDVQAMIDYRDDLGANVYRGGLYGGWLEVYDQYSDRLVWMPPSGDVAANFVQAFKTGERWDAVAGLRRGVIPGVTSVSLVANEADRDLLYAKNINPITTISGATAVIWGQKTLQILDSSLSSINVVTNVMWLTGSMKEALQAYVFQNNTRQTRDNIVYNLTRFLEDVKVREGLYDYDVVCDETNNTPYVIDQGQIIVDVFVQPVRTGEVIKLNVIVTPTGMELSVS